MSSKLQEPDLLLARGPLQLQDGNEGPAVCHHPFSLPLLDGGCNKVYLAALRSGLGLTGFPKECPDL